jgi:hypothetical protein
MLHSFNFLEVPLQPDPAEQLADFVLRVAHISQDMNRYHDPEAHLCFERQEEGTIRAVMRMRIPPVLVDPHLYR